MWLNVANTSRRESYGRPKRLRNALSARGHGFHFVVSGAVDACAEMRLLFVSLIFFLRGRGDKDGIKPTGTDGVRC